MYKVLIRADGGSSIGMGHVMRCISLGKIFLKEGYEVVFISKYKEGKEKIHTNGFDVIPLSAKAKEGKIQSGFSYGDPMNLEIEKKELINILKNQKADILIIDHYNVTKDFFLSLKPHVNILAYIDDVNAFTYPVDVVINGNITGEYTDYESYFENQKFLLGPSYNLIRDEFQNIPKRAAAKEVKKILMTTGGADPFNITEKLIDTIRGEGLFNKMELHVIVGGSFQNKNEIKEKQNQYENIVLYENVKKISSIMLDCDIALSSCGSTLYELCACGVPTLGFIVADNQVLVAEKMNELGYIKNLGWHHGLKKKNTVYEIKEFIDDYELRSEMVKKQQALVDGKGTERVVNEITKLMREKEGVICE